MPGTNHSLGVHLNLRHESYIDDLGLGYSGLKLLAVNPIEWWFASAWNPLRPPEPPKAAFNRGEAGHVAFLDGLKVYNRLYGRMPTGKTHPDYADTIAELLALCGKHGLSKVYIQKAELVDRLQRAKVKEKILAVEQAKFLRTGRRPISETDDNAIRMTQRMAMRSRQELNVGASHLTLRQAFTGGLHEVSVFWVDENGIRQRARFDKIKPNMTLDLKTLTDWKKSDFKQSLLREAIIRGYVLQWAHYDEGRRQLCKAVDEGRVFGGTPMQRKKLDAIAEAADWAWVWVYAKLDGAPQVRGIVPDRAGPQYAKAVEQRAQALTWFQFYREMYGMETPWFDPEVVWVPQDIDWPSWAEDPT